MELLITLVSVVRHYVVINIIWNWQAVVVQ